MSKKREFHVPAKDGLTACGKVAQLTGWTRAMITCKKCQKTEEYKNLEK